MSLEKAFKKVHELDLTAEAWDLFEVWAENRYKDALDAPSQLQPLYGRIESHALKFAMIFSISEKPESQFVEPENVKAATVCADYCLQSYRRLVLEELAFSLNEKKLKKIQDIIKQKGKASERDIARGTRYLKKELKDLLLTLITAGKIRHEPGPKGGSHYIWMG